jgi:hypothetical protein
MINYKLITNSTSIIKIDEEQKQYGIPFAPDNTDYQAYLKWVSKGNEPLPADE